MAGKISQGYQQVSIFSDIPPETKLISAEIEECDEKKRPSFFDECLFWSLIEINDEYTQTLLKPVSPKTDYMTQARRNAGGPDNDSVSEVVKLDKQRI